MIRVASLFLAGILAPKNSSLNHSSLTSPKGQRRREGQRGREREQLLPAERREGGEVDGGRGRARVVRGVGIGGERRRGVVGDGRSSGQGRVGLHGGRGCRHGR